MTLDRWKKAVVHLEGATDSVQTRQRMARIEKLQQRRAAGEITWEQFSEEAARLEYNSRDERFHGTAVYLEHEQRRYLLTARHVLHDETATVGIEAPELIVEKLARDAVYPIIFRVPGLDEVLEVDPEATHEVLMNLGAGTLDDRPVTFSDPELDLAVVSLDRYPSIVRFADELDAIGFQPIHLDDVADGPSAEGAEIFTVGFPGATAELPWVLDLPPARAHWASRHVSLPTFAFGKVSMVHEQLPYFWCDISAYPGNSGGPLVENNKLVGIVSGQAYIEEKEVEIRIPFAHVIKAEHIRPLLAHQFAQPTRFR